MGVDGITVSPGYAYERAPDQQHFLNRSKTKQLFRDIFAPRQGRQEVDVQPVRRCSSTSWPATRPITARRGATRRAPCSAGRRPCYLLGEGYAKTFKELMEDTEWDNYGVGNYEKCADCMVHCGFEGTAVADAIRSPLKALRVSITRCHRDRRDGAGYPARQAAARRNTCSRAMSRRRSRTSTPRKRR